MSGFYFSNGLHRRLGYEPEQKRPSDLLGEIDNEPRPALLFRRSRHARERHKSVLVKIVAWRREARFVLSVRSNDGASANRHFRPCTGIIETRRSANVRKRALSFVRRFCISANATSEQRIRQSNPPYLAS